ncbi:cation:proton antiporter [Flavobacterium sp. WLB]|uniref:cation:proton antiporter domain-containing protein n=1 Tax=Flavobacterium sp. WLB TaxID=2161662 RepID=UPI001FAFFD41|nr:cation:proton antiporter [Flavobacterium sp. WLB]
MLSLIVLLLILLLRRLKQPYFIAYIAAGVLLGPQVFKILKLSYFSDRFFLKPLIKTIIENTKTIL